MPGESASRWPLRHRQTLANLQDAGLIPRPVHANQSIAEVHIRRPQKKAASRCRTNPQVLHRQTASAHYQLNLLPNHRQHILRYRIERRHSLGVRLERPLRHNQIRKLC